MAKTCSHGFETHCPDGCVGHTQRSLSDPRDAEIAKLREELARTKAKYQMAIDNAATLAVATRAPLRELLSRALPLVEHAAHIMSGDAAVSSAEALAKDIRAALARAGGT